MPVTYKITEPFYHNFDLSVVIPFYRKMIWGTERSVYESVG